MTHPDEKGRRRKKGTGSRAARPPESAAEVLRAGCLSPFSVPFFRGLTNGYAIQSF